MELTKTEQQVLNFLKQNKSEFESLTSFDSTTTLWGKTLFKQSFFTWRSHLVNLEKKGKINRVKQGRSYKMSLA